MLFQFNENWTKRTDILALNYQVRNQLFLNWSNDDFAFTKNGNPKICKNYLQELQEECYKLEIMSTDSKSKFV